MPEASFMDYAAYDYYDWVCDTTSNLCQLCDVLTGACCNPANQANCFLPDSCANNPCLSGGTCITTTTINGQPDFVCVCTRGLTGKYCQLVDDFTPALVVPVAPVAPPTPPSSPPSSAQRGFGGMSGPMGALGGFGGMGALGGMGAFGGLGGFGGLNPLGGLGGLSPFGTLG